VSFDSEFCIQGPCSIKTIKSFLAEKNHWPPNEAWIYHIQRGHQNLPHYEQTLRIAGATFGEIDSLQKYVKHGQATHLEQMRAEFESARQDYPNNGGTMMWMFNDCWPTSNWSIIDYYGSPKPSYYAAKRACAPILPIILERKGKTLLSVSNHTSKDISCNVIYGICTLSGEITLRLCRDFTVAAYGCHRFDSLSSEELKAEPNEYIFIDAIVDARTLPRVTYFQNMWKNVPFEKASISLKVYQSVKAKDKYLTKLELSSMVYARLAHVLYVGEGSVWFDDNYFDIPATDLRYINVSSECPLDETSLICGDWFTDWE